MFMPVNIFGKKRTDDEKDRQIRELRVTFPSLRRPNNDDELFEMLFEVEKAYSTLRIYLKPEFPSLKPVLQVVGPVTHPWLDRYKIVTGCEKLNTWTKGSSLAEVVELTLSKLQSGTNIVSQGISPSSTSTSGAAVSNLAGYPALSSQYPTRLSPVTQQSSTLKQGNSNPSIQSNNNNNHGQGQGMSAYPTFPSNPNSNVGDGGAGVYPVLSNSKGYGSSSSTATTTAAAAINNGNGNQFYGNSQDPHVQEYGFASSCGSPSKPHQSEVKEPYCDPPYYESAILQNSNLTSQSNSNTNSNDNSNMTSSKGYGDSAKSESVYSDRAMATRITVPPIPSSFTEIQNLSSHQLEKLTKDDVAIHNMVVRLSTAESMGPLSLQLRQSNQEQAELNLSKDSELNFLLNEAKTLKLELNTRSTLYENKLRDAKKKYAISSSEILNQIQAKKESLDMHSENLLKSFSEGNIDMSTFIQDFLDTRTNYHEIAGKVSALSTR